jgi:hypothetical protein
LLVAVLFARVGVLRFVVAFVLPGIASPPERFAEEITTHLVPAFNRRTKSGVYCSP